MKIYLLVVFMSWPFGGISNEPVYEKVVESPEHAAIVVWDYQRNSDIADPRHYRGRLFEIELKEKETTIKEIYIKEYETTIKEIEIPLIKFGQKDKDR